MALIRAIQGQRIAEPANWQMALAPADCDTPADTAALDWIAAPVPGTAAEALTRAGRATPELLATLHTRDVWYRTTLNGQGAAKLVCDGLATLCDIWLDGVKIGQHTTMFEPVTCAVTFNGSADLHLHFRPLTAENLRPATRRQRWRPHLIASPQMRQARASLLGHMPGWCPDIAPVGPYRPVRLVQDAPLAATDARVRLSLEGTTGLLDVSLRLSGSIGPAHVQCAGVSAPLMPDGEIHSARLAIPDVPLWWPHTHGTPHRHAVRITAGGATIDLGHVGFRTLSLDRGTDGHGFGLVINGVRVFCRGANWTNADLARLPGARADYLPLLTLARDAGMNMLRVPGIMTLESRAFFDLCDEMGILVWQDMMFANFDYDLAPEAAGGALLRELDGFLDATETSPALAVVCGGSEMAQQAAMLSLPPQVWSQPFLTDTFPAHVAARRPDVVAVPNSPWGGDLPFATNRGVSHYFGVGAYQRPLDDARRADVRFAAECLAFAHLPQPEHLGAQTAAAPGTPDWKARVVRDLKADWDFEDTRDFYTSLLYGVDCAALKTADPARYLALASATPGEVMETTFAEWRRAGSHTSGALVWHLSDIGPGFGWGVTDSEARPKPAYFALKRAFRPVTVALTDEGLNGLCANVLNDSPVSRRLGLSLTCYGADGAVVIDGHTRLVVAPHAVQALTSATLFGVFFDVTHAYRFGPPAHVVTVARLTDAQSGACLAEAFHFPQGRSAAMAPAHVTSRLERQGTAWLLHLTADRLAQSVHISAPEFVPKDDWFHLAPGAGRIVRLMGAGTPEITISTLNTLA